MGVLILVLFLFISWNCRRHISDRSSLERLTNSEISSRLLLPRLKPRLDNDSPFHLSQAVSLVTITDWLWPFSWDVFISTVSHILFCQLLIAVIILTMIGPEARKVDHIKEREADFREDHSSDHSGDKIQGHAEKFSGEHSDTNIHQELHGERRSEATLDDSPPKLTEKEIA